MPTTAVYIQFGAKPAASASHTDQCDHCTPSMRTKLLPGMSFGAEPDAQTTALDVVTGTALLQAYVPQLWNSIWDHFRCDNEDCKNRDSCSNKPTYFEYGAVTVSVQAPGQPLPQILWHLYLTIAREIRCIKGEGKNLDPEIPKIPKRSEEEDGQDDRNGALSDASPLPGRMPLLVEETLLVYRAPGTAA